MPYIRKPIRIKKPKKREKNTERAKDRAEIYASPIWRRLRIGYLMAHPLCEQCLEAGRTTSAVEVHHRDSFMGYDGTARLQKAYDPTNLMAICRACHEAEHMKGGSYTSRFDSEKDERKTRHSTDSLPGDSAR